MENVKIEWSKMHRMNYGGTCAFCGGKCTDADSEQNWTLAYEQLNAAEMDGDTQRAKYLRGKIQSKLTYKFTN